MATTMATMGVINPKISSFNAPKKPAFKPVTLPTGLVPVKTPIPVSTLTAVSRTALAGVVFSALAGADPAMAAQQIAEIAEGDNRGLALLLPIIPAIGWVLFNILQPALNQIDRMRSQRAVIIGLGLSGLGAFGLFSGPNEAWAGEVAQIGEVTSDSRGQLLLFVILPAIGWVLYNILQPALNQINRMRSQ